MGARAGVATTMVRLAHHERRGWHHARAAVGARAGRWRAALLARVGGVRFVAGCLLTRGAGNFIVNTVCDAIAGACLLLGCSVLGGFRRPLVERGCG